MVGAAADHELCDDLAEEGRAAVIAGVVADTLSNPVLRADLIHPNAAGYAALSRAAARALRRCR